MTEHYKRMKTTDEIKKGLECGFCHECPYDSNELETVEECARQVHKDALAYINQLERENASLDKAVRDAAELMQSGADLMRKRFEELEHSLSEAEEERERLMNVDAARVANIQLLEDRLAQAERERDAAVKDARLGTMCDTCRYNANPPLSDPCMSCGELYPFWEWRGVCEENSKESSHDI